MSLVDYEFDSDNEEEGVLLNAAATQTKVPTGSTDCEARPQLYADRCGSPPAGRLNADDKKYIVCTGGTNGVTTTHSGLIRRLSESEGSTPSPELLLSNGNRPGDFVPLPASSNAGGDNNSTNSVLKIDGTTGTTIDECNGSVSGGMASDHGWDGCCLLDNAPQLNEAKSTILTKTTSINATGSGTGTGTNGNNLSSWSSSVLPGFLEDPCYMDPLGSSGATGTTMKDSAADPACGPRAELENRLLNKLSLIDHEDENALCRALCNPYLMETIMKRYCVEPHTSHFQDRFATTKHIAKERAHFEQFLSGSLGRSFKSQKQHTGGTAYTGNTRMIDSAIVNGVASCNAVSADSGTGDGTDNARKRLRRSKWDDPAPSRFADVGVDNCTGGMHTGKHSGRAFSNHQSKNVNSTGNAELPNNTAAGANVPNGVPNIATGTESTHTSINRNLNGSKWNAPPTSDHSAAYPEQDTVCTATRGTGTGFGTQSSSCRTADADMTGRGEVPYRERSRSPSGAVPVQRRTGSNFSKLSPENTKGGIGTRPTGTGSNASRDVSPSSGTGRSYHGSRRRRSWDRYEHRYDTGRDRDRNESRSGRYRDEIDVGRSSEHHKSSSSGQHRIRGPRDAAGGRSQWHSSSTRRRGPVEFSPPFEAPRAPRRRVVVTADRHSPHAFN